MEQTWKERPLSWIQFQDKDRMTQWIKTNKEVPEPGMVVAEIDWDALRVYFITHTINNLK